MKKFLAVVLCFVLFISLSAQEESSKYYSVVALPKMNVVYVGLENPVEIMVAGISYDKITVSIVGGTVSPTGPYKFKITPNSSSKSVTLNVIADINGKKVSAGTHEFRVKHVPDPIATVGDYKGGSISKDLLLSQTGVSVILENFDFDINFKVVSFSVATNISGYTQESTSNSNIFTPDQKKIFNNLNSGDKVYVENILAKGPDGTIRPMASIIFKID
ncbi:MAG: GldM family protein [Bacteroidota bacterium]